MPMRQMSKALSVLSVLLVAACEDVPVPAAAPASVSDCPLAGKPAWSSQVVNLVAECETRLPSPDGRRVLIIDKDGTVRVAGDASKASPIPTTFRIEPPAMTSWSPRSDAFFVNDGEGSGQTSVFRYFKLGAAVAESDAPHREAVRLYREHANCPREALDPNVWGLGWSYDGQRAYLLTQATNHQPCGVPDQFVVYSLDTRTLEIVARDDAASATIKFAPLLPDNLESVSPERTDTERRLQHFMDAYGAKRREAAPAYRYGLVDLDGDGVDEAIVRPEGRNWCGSGGCAMLVLARQGDRYVLVSKTTITWPPIQVLPTSTNGWNDLSVFVSGGGLEPHDVILRFDGRRYPLNPSGAPAEAAPARPAGDVVIAPVW